jgi:lipoprotein signal peptidase
MTARSRRLTAAATAAAFGAVDLLQKATAGDVLHHDRSPGAFLLMAAVVAGLLLLVPLVPWTPVAIGAGIAAGGALGNLVSMLVWSGGVPDPLVVPGVVAFNLADVFVLAGDALLLTTAALYALRHPHELRARL